MSPQVNFYKNIHNREEIETLLRPYSIQECMSDIEFFPELVQDLIEDHAHIENLDKVLDRMLSHSLKVGGFRL